MNVSVDGHDEPATTDKFFKEASAACDWEAATTETTDARGTRTSYYLSRLRIRAARTFSPAPSGFGTWAPSGLGSPSFRGI